MLPVGVDCCRRWRGPCALAPTPMASDKLLRTARALDPAGARAARRAGGATSRARARPLLRCRAHAGAPAVATAARGDERHGKASAAREQARARFVEAPRWRRRRGPKAAVLPRQRAPCGSTRERGQESWLAAERPKDKEPAQPTGARRRRSSAAMPSVPPSQALARPCARAWSTLTGLPNEQLHITPVAVRDPPLPRARSARRRACVRRARRSAGGGRSSRSRARAVRRDGRQDERGRRRELRPRARAPRHARALRSRRAPWPIAASSAAAASSAEIEDAGRGVDETRAAAAQSQAIYSARRA